MEKENMFVNEVDHCSFFNINPNWEISMDQNDPFESALSSMVSSPTASNTNGNNGENIVLRELIGRLGSICNSGDISPHHQQQQTYNRSISIINTTNSTNTSCYSTPLNSPPKLNNLSMMENQQQIRGGSSSNNNYHPNLAPFSTDPGFAERAARYSCFAPQNNNEMGSQRLDSVISTGSHPMDDKKFKPEFADSVENSSVSDQQIPIAGVANSRKRKSIPKGKGKETPPPPLPAKDAHVGSENSESSSVKRSKSEEEKNAAKELKDKSSKQQTTTTTTEAPKDYIHVRARRGQATDAHSLAERVRREKISERMKFLQDLVPGCNKVTGKAVMLDEIINYVQSLQRQVEFLSMKLATVNPRMDVNVEALMSKDMFQSHNIYRSDGYPFQSQPNSHSDVPSAAADVPFQANNNFNAAFGRSQSIQLPPMDNFTETASQVSTFWEDDLHSVVQMEFGQNQTQFSWLVIIRVQRTRYI